jgi:CRISPR/Cas system-associated exonuclease Cas4 (RecB family)
MAAEPSPAISSTKSESDDVLELPVIAPLNVVEAQAYTWSFSKYKVYKECNERYAREYLMRLRVPPVSEKPFLQGNIAHGLIEAGRDAILMGETDDFRGWCLSRVDEHFDRHAAKIQDWGLGEVDRARREAHQLVESYIALVLENDLLTGNVLCEHTIGTHKDPRRLDNGVGLVGYIDWAKLAGEQTVVLDAKTSRNMAYIDKDQLVFYALALEHEFGVGVHRVAWMMIRHNKTYWYDVTPEEKASLKARLLTASQEVAQLNLTSDPRHPLCTPCVHNSDCTAYAHWLVGGGVVDMDADF